MECNGRGCLCFPFCYLDAGEGGVKQSLLGVPSVDTVESFALGRRGAGLGPSGGEDCPRVSPCPLDVATAGVWWVRPSSLLDYM